jgi:hypothetical protein
MQIIIGAMVGGVLLFAVIAVVVRSSMVEAGGTRIISIIAIAVALSSAVASLIIPKSIAAQKLALARPKANTESNAGRQQDFSGGVVDWLAIYQTRMIVHAALLESAAFFLLIAYLVEGMILDPLVAAIYLLALAALFPTRQKIERWMEEQKQAANWRD